MHISREGHGLFRDQWYIHTYMQKVEVFIFPFFPMYINAHKHTRVSILYHTGRQTTHDNRVRIPAFLCSHTLSFSSSLALPCTYKDISYIHRHLVHTQTSCTFHRHLVHTQTYPEQHDSSIIAIFLTQIRSSYAHPSSNFCIILRIIGKGHMLCTCCLGPFMNMHRRT